MKRLSTILCALLIAVCVSAQVARTVSGLVTDESGEPLAGASVTLAGTGQGTVSDARGIFSLTIPAGQKSRTITVAFVGMEPQSVTLSSTNPKPLIVRLAESAQTLEGVVVTGYQTVSKERVTGSFGTVSSKQLEAKLGSDLRSLVEGKIAGLVLDKDGNISIRGISSLNAETAPLVVVDGYPAECSLADLNPDNIENITVLKDGVAASIYGSRAANGVIVVTTKAGQKGKTRLSYRGSFRFTPKPDLDYLHMASTNDFIDAELGLYDLNPSSYVISKKSQKMSDVEYLLIKRDAGMISEGDFNGQIAALRGNNVLRDMEKYMFRTAFTQTHNIGINGGTEADRFNLAVNYTNNRASYINTNDDRLLLDFKNEWTPYKFLTLGASANINYSRSDAPQTSWQTLANMYSYIKPYTRLVDDAGNPADIRTLSYATSELYAKYPGMKETSYNPITDASRDYRTTESFSARFSAFLRVKILEGLTGEVGGNWMRGSGKVKAISEADSYKMRLLYNDATSIKTPSNHYVPDGDMIDETRTSSDSWTIRTQLNFSREFGRHRISALAGNEVRRLSYDNNTYATRFGYNATAGSFTPVNMKDLKGGAYKSDMVGGNTLPTSVTYGSYALRDNRFVSWYFNGAYEYDDRYLVSGSVREDLTNFFGTDPKYRHKPLWSVGGTWKLNHESFFHAPWVNRLNLRASYGVNGNISLAEGPYLILSAGSYSSVTGGVSYGIASFPNNSLRWEKTKTFNFGLDFDILDNRLGFSFDYYLKKSTDILAADAMDPTTGVSKMTKNVGAIDNQGFEFAIHGTPVKTRDFRWDVAYNLSLNKNEVKKYNVNRKYPTSWAYTTPIHAEGHPMYGFFGYTFAGLNDKGEVQIVKGDGTVGLAQEATVDDISYQGSALPKTDMSLTNSFSYKGWDLSFMLIAKLGHKYRKDVFQGSNYNSRFVGQRWQKPGDEEHTIYPMLASNNSDLFYFPFCDVNVGNASYMKLRDVTLAYNFPRQLISHIGMANAKIYLQARNLFRITAKGCDIDPETFDMNFSGGMGAQTNAGYSTLPLNPEYYIGLTFSF